MGKLFLNKKKIQLSNQQDNSIQESIENLSKSDISETFDTEQELKQFRQVNVKHYQQSDGSIVAKVFPHAVHYYHQQDHRFREIDHHLQENKENQTYQTKYNHFHVIFPKTLKNEICSIQKEDVSIHFLTDKESHIPVSIKKETLEETIIIYPNIAPQTDLELMVKGYKIKCNLILKDKSASNRYSMKMTCKNLRPTLDDDQKTLSFYSITDGKLKYFMPAPIMYDASEQCSEDISYEIEEKEDGYLLTIIANQAWLEDASRVYPVTLDPEIDIPDIQDNLSSYYYNGSAVVEAPTEVLFGIKNNQTHIGYYAFQSRSMLPSGSIILKATLSVPVVSYVTALLYSVYPVKSVIQVGATKPTTDETAFVIDAYPSGSEVAIDITSPLTKYFNYDGVYGIAITARNEVTPSSYGSFGGVQSSTKAPTLTIRYFRKKKLITNENVKKVAVGKNGQLILPFVTQCKYFQYDHTFLPELTISHLYSDTLYNRDYEVNLDGQAISPSFHLGPCYKTNLHQYLILGNDEKEVTYLDFLSNSIPFRKKYYYESQGNLKFVNEEDVTSIANEFYYIDEENHKTKLTKTYFSDDGRILEMNFEKSKLLNALGKPRTLRYYVVNEKDEKIILNIDETGAFSYKMAYLEGTEGFIVDPQYITIENGEEVFNQNGIYRKVDHYDYVTMKVLFINGEESVSSQTIRYNQKGKIESYPSYLTILKEFTFEDEYLPFYSLSDELMNVDNQIQNLYQQKIELEDNLAYYKKENPLQDLQEQYNKVRDRYSNLQAKYKNESYCLNSKRIDDEIENIKENGISQNNQISLFTRRISLDSVIEKQNKLESLEKEKQILNQNRTLTDLEDELYTLQCMLESEQSYQEEKQKETYINQLTSSISTIEEKMVELQEQLKVLVEEERKKALHYLYDSSSIMGFDDNGVLVFIQKAYHQYHIIYENQFLTRIEDQNQNSLVSFEYQNDLLSKIQDDSGKTVQFIYNTANILQDIIASNGDQISFYYYSRGLNQITDEYGDKTVVVTGDYGFNTSFIKNVEEINKDGIVTKSTPLTVSGDTITYINDNTTHLSLVDSNKKYCFTFNELGTITSQFEVSTPVSSSIRVNQYAKCHVVNQDEEYVLYVDEKSKNYLKNGNFESGSTSWTCTGAQATSSSDLVNGTKALKFIGHPLQQRILSQTIAASDLPSSKALLFSGWAKADSTYITMTQYKTDPETYLESTSSSKFELRIQATYSDGTQETKRTTFDWFNKDWQWCGIPIFIDEEKTLTSITVYADYSYNINEVYFDHFQLTEAKGEYYRLNEDRSIQFYTDFKNKTIYEAYEKGKPSIIKTIDELHNVTTTKYTYDLDGALIREENEQGLITEYEYQEDEDNQTTTNLTFIYHQDEPTTRYIQIETLDHLGRIVQQGDGKDEQVLTQYFTYQNEKSTFPCLIQEGKQKQFIGYDKNEDYIQSKSQVIQRKDHTLLYHYTAGLLTQVQNKNGCSIQYAYDQDKNISKILINNLLMTSYQKQKNVIIDSSTNQKGAIYTTTYPDGTIVEKRYNNQDQLVSIYHKYGQDETTGCIYKNTYNDKNQLITSCDEYFLIDTSYTYNEDQLLSSYERVKGSEHFEESYQYNDWKDITSITQIFDENDSFTYQFEYDSTKPHVCNQKTLPNQIQIKPSLDLLNRICQKDYSYNNHSFFLEKYTYQKVNNQTFDRIQSIQTFINNQTQDFLEYEYDNNGNVCAIYQDGFLTHRYAYDDSQRLIQEYNVKEGTKTSFVYDYNGNILSKTKINVSNQTILHQDRYIYAHQPFSDLLTSFNGETCTYDDYGKLLTYRNQTVSFHSRCSKLTQLGNTTFTYDSLGCRTGKNQVKYICDNQGRLLKEVNGTHTILYFYDGLSICSIQVDGQSYFLRRNLFQDVTHIYDLNGNLVASYLYDAWGNHQVFDANGVENTNADFIGNINPIRYRGYYFDVETNLYYLNSRYYDPEVGRFISLDAVDYLAPDSIHGLNLFAYCFNNPIMYADPSGHFAISTLLISITLGAAFAVGTAYGTDVIENIQDGFQWSDLINPLKENWKEYVIAGLKGVVTGIAFGVGAGLGISAFKAGVRISAKTAITAFIATTAGSVAAGMGIYALETKVFGLSEYNNSDLWKSGVKMGIKGVLNFGMGLLLGNQGFFNVKNGLIQRTYLKSTLMTPTDMIIEVLIDSMW